MSRTIAVTGASGFIGRYLCNALEARGDTVLAIGRTNTDYSRDSLELALNGASALIHLAGRRMTRDDDPLDITPFYEPNVAVLAPLVHAARTTGIRRVLLASTIAVYSPASGTPYREDAPLHPVNAYALSKVMAEHHLAMLTRTDGPAACALRLAAVYGPGEKGTPALMTFVNRSRAGKPLVINGNPDHRIDELYVRDATTGIIAALDSDYSGPINLGSGRASRLEDIARTAADVFGAPSVTVTGETRPAPDTTLDITRAGAQLGWSPNHDLRRGMEDFRRTLGA